MQNSKFSYQTVGTCCRQIEVDVKEGKIDDVVFHGGCNGNLQGIASLVKGMQVEDVIEKLQNINCKGRGTSCPDQLTKALIANM